MIIFIYGEDTFRAKEKLRNLEEKFKKDVDPGGESIKHVDGEKVSVDELSQALGASSLFSSKRLIVVENIFSHKEKNIFKDLRDYLLQEEKKERDVKNENVLIFVDETDGKKLGRNVLWQYLISQRFVQKFEALSATAVSQWIKRRAKELGANITQAQSMHMSGVLGTDLWLIENELKKIIHYKKGQVAELLEGGEVDIEDADLKLMTRGVVDDNIFAFTDAISAKNKREALRLFENELEAGMAEQYLLHMIIRQFRILLSVRQALDSGLSQRKMSTDLKLHPFVVQKSIKQAGAYSLDLLKKIFESLVEIDKEIKTGKTDFKIAISTMITKL